MKRDDVNLNRDAPVVPDDEELEVQEQEVSDSHAKMIETMDYQSHDDDDGSASARK